MLYLVTNQENKTWRNVVWGEGITHEESNSNYLFTVYDNLLVAAFMYPTYDGIAYDKSVTPKIWEAVGEKESDEQCGFYKKYAKLTTVKEVPFQNPNINQRMNFAILCAMNLVLNDTFKNWAIDYLMNKDQTKETAHAVSEKLTTQLSEDLPPDQEYYTCAYPVLAAVMLNEPAEFCANAAHRAYFDAIDKNVPLNLEQLAQIAVTLTGPDIAKVF